MPVQAGEFDITRSRPRRVELTADASWILGGWTTSHPAVATGDFGRLRWRSWARRGAWGVGALWINPCRPSCGSDHYIAHRAVVHAVHPNVAGVFQVLIVSTRAHATRFDALHRSGPGGGWEWRYAAVVHRSRRAVTRVARVRLAVTLSSEARS